MTEGSPVGVPNDRFGGEARPLGLCAGAHFNHATCSNSVAQADDAFDLGAMFAAKECAFLFEPVTDDMNTAIVAGRSQRMDRATQSYRTCGSRRSYSLETPCRSRFRRFRILP